MSFQSITILGNLTRDAEVRQVGQSQVAKIGIAVSEKYKDRNGQIQESTEYFDVEVWDKAGVFPYLLKGQAVLIVGQQKTDRWQDQSGQNRETKKVRAQVVQLCGQRPQQQQYQQAPQYQQPAPPPAPGYAPQYQQPAPQYQQPPMPPRQPAPQPPMPPQPGQPGNQQYPPMNSPAYTELVSDDLPM